MIYRQHPLLRITRTPADLFRWLAVDLELPEPLDLAGEIDVDDLLKRVQAFNRVASMILEMTSPEPADSEVRGYAVDLKLTTQRFLETFEEQEALLPTCWYSLDGELRTVEPDWVVRWLLSAGRGHQGTDSFRVADCDLEGVGLLTPPSSSALDWIRDVEDADRLWLRAHLDASQDARAQGAEPLGLRDPADVFDDPPVGDDPEGETPAPWIEQKEMLYRTLPHAGFLWDRAEWLAEREEVMSTSRPRGWRTHRHGSSFVVAVPLRQQQALYGLYRLTAAIWVRLLSPAPAQWEGRDDPITEEQVQSLRQLRSGRNPVHFPSWSETGRATTPEQDDLIAAFMTNEATAGSAQASARTPRLLDVAEGAPNNPCWSVIGSLLIAHGMWPPRSWAGLLRMVEGLLYAVQPVTAVAALASSAPSEHVPDGPLDMMSRQLVSLINESNEFRRPLPRICQHATCRNYYLRQPPREAGSNWSPHARGTSYCTRECANAARQARHRKRV